SAPIEERRQGTEPSRRFLIDLDTGMLKEHSSEMDRRVSGCTCPTTWSMGGSLAMWFLPRFYNYPSNYEFRQGTQNSQATLVDISTGQLLPHHLEMQRSTAPLDEYSPATLMTLRKAQIDMESTDSVAIDTTHEVAPPELQKQGTEPSRRFLMDLNTGMLKERKSEMDRRVSGFYNYPSNYEFRQGTQDSQVTLIDLRTGQQLEPLSEMQRRAALGYHLLC
ncbi:uncharacterized protein wu:fa56d06, partial [Electrophorus electricus]|uniref:uncharacterized protein wu:fa56d06 n=1 Tax=Electrophorus electricus TaxID=8005 RepID=UPI0015CF8D6C